MADKERLKEIKFLMESGHLIQLRRGHETFNTVEWLIEQAEKYQKLHDTWMNGIEDTSYETIQFLRVCKEVIEDFKPDYRKPMA